jgi:hypothetical protein
MLAWLAWSETQPSTSSGSCCGAVRRAWRGGPRNCPALCDKNSGTPLRLTHGVHLADPPRPHRAGAPIRTLSLLSRARYKADTRIIGKGGSDGVRVVSATADRWLAGAAASRPAHGGGHHGAATSTSAPKPLPCRSVLAAPHRPPWAGGHLPDRQRGRALAAQLAVIRWGGTHEPFGARRPSISGAAGCLASRRPVEAGSRREWRVWGLISLSIAAADK